MWNKAAYPSTNEHIIEMRYSYTIDSYSAIKNKNESMKLEGKWNWKIHYKLVNSDTNKQIQCYVSPLWIRDSNQYVCGCVRESVGIGQERRRHPGKGERFSRKGLGS